MQEQISPTLVEHFWRKLFPDQIPERLLVPDPLPDNELYLEGHKLVAVNTGWTDTAQSTCLYVPSVGLLVGGDAVYNRIHPYLAETNTESRLEWISSLDKLESLNPKVVIAGHKIPKNQDERIIAETRQYLRDFNRLDKATTTARQLYDAMLELYPDRANPGSLWGGTNVAKKEHLAAVQGRH
jgi:glyoxylase-like metal-dependent hydrolase (beta-lactamase superfamily II)